MLSFIGVSGLQVSLQGGSTLRRPRGCQCHTLQGQSRQSQYAASSSSLFSRLQCLSLSSSKSCTLSMMARSQNPAAPPWARDLVPTQGLLVTKRDLQASARSGRCFRLARWSTLGDVEAGLPHEADRRIDVWLVAQKTGQDFLVHGMVSSELERECDRCLCKYNAPANGTFEVLLATSSVTAHELFATADSTFEAVVDFSGTDPCVDMASHVHDAVLLSLPTKSLCKKDCGGVLLSDGTTSFAKYGVVRSDAPRLEEPTTRLSGDAAEKLAEAKRRLERQFQE